MHFASPMDICHLKNLELEPKFQKYKGRVVLRGDTVKDDSGSYAVFTGQGSPASQMTAARVMNVIARPPGCAGQAADAVSAYTQVKMEDAPFNSPTARSHPQGSSPKVDSSVRDASKSRGVESRPEAKSRSQPIQRAVEGNDLQHGEHGVRRDLRDHSQSIVAQLYDRQKALKTALAEHVCDLQTKLEN